jgi:hypothetical protein
MTQLHYRAFPTQGLRTEMAAALQAGSADLDVRERAVRDAERRVAAQQVGATPRERVCVSVCVCACALVWGKTRLLHSSFLGGVQCSSLASCASSAAVTRNTHTPPAQAELLTLQQSAAGLAAREADITASRERLDAAAAALAREQHSLARERAQLQVRLRQSWHALRCVGLCTLCAAFIHCAHCVHCVLHSYQHTLMGCHDARILVDGLAATHWLCRITN